MTVFYSLQMKILMVEVVISLVVLCGESRDGSMLSLWVFVGRFHSTCPDYLVLWGCVGSNNTIVIFIK
jgi:hypothetical protein